MKRLIFICIMFTLCLSNISSAQYYKNGLQSTRQDGATTSMYPHIATWRHSQMGMIARIFLARYLMLAVWESVATGYAMKILLTRQVYRTVSLVGRGLPSRMSNTIGYHMYRHHRIGKDGGHLQQQLLKVKREPHGLSGEAILF